MYRPELSNISPKAIIGSDCVIHAGVHIHDEVVIGNNCKIQAMAFLPNGLTLEDDVFVGPGVVFTNDSTLQHKDNYQTPTLVKRGAKIGANVTIRAGVTIGQNSIIGCGSVVLKDVPPNETWVGNPAHKMNKLTREDV